MAAHLLQRIHQFVVGQTGIAQDSRSRAALVQDRGQHVLDRYVFVLEFARFLFGARKNPA